MFTGLIEEIGRIGEFRKIGDRFDLVINANLVSTDVKVDDSIAVNGVCLTVVDHNRDYFQVQVIPQTVRMSALTNYSAGDEVNLERAMAAGDRFGGHFVQGHVDGTAKVASWHREKEDIRLQIQLGENLMKFCVDQGSICIDGVSLTIAGIQQNLLEVALIPHTLEATTLGQRSPGDLVNIEVDMLSKYVYRHLHPDEQSGMTMEWLKEQGFTE